MRIFHCVTFLTLLVLSKCFVLARERREKGNERGAGQSTYNTLIRLMSIATRVQAFRIIPKGRNGFPESGCNTLEMNSEGRQDCERAGPLLDADKRQCVWLPVPSVRVELCPRQSSDLRRARGGGAQGDADAGCVHEASGPVACEVSRSDRADVELHLPSMGSLSSTS